jgi:hypothetical protein
LEISKENLYETIGCLVSYTIKEFCQHIMMAIYKTGKDLLIVNLAKTTTCV